MVGLNHEMSRELLWREYPTDRRGTYFRQFWDVPATASPTPEQRDAMADLHPIASWTDDTHLGDHAGRATAEGQMVCWSAAILFRRFPRAMVYAVEAVWSADARGERSAPQQYPMFRATQAPDITSSAFS